MGTLLMANRFFQQFFFSLNHYPVWLEGSADIGASGAASGLKGSGLLSLTRKAAGVYELKLEDNYSKFLAFDVKFAGPVTGAAVTAGSFVSGTLYRILTVGNTDYTAVGLPAGITAAPGATFVASGAGAGTGTVKAITESAVYKVELVGDPSLMDSPSVQGAVLHFVCWDAAGSPVDPADGSKMWLQVCYRNSSVKGKGE